MHFRVIFRILGVLLMVFSLTMLIPLLIAMYLGEATVGGFAAAFAITFFTGFGVWFPIRKAKHDLRTRDGFVVTVLFWVVLGIAGALPFYLPDGIHMSWVDSVFESLSGLTTTGATVIVGIDHLPKSILYYRQQLQWLGGMGIVVLAVAVLPMLGIGGMQLYRAETPGPVKDTKLTPRITETAKALWYIYAGLTLACFLAYWAAGMSAFDAISHSFSTVAIGGFSTNDASIGFFDSPAIESIAIIFMLLSGVNYGLHFAALSGFRLSHYWSDPEFKFYLLVIGSTFLLTLVTLWISNTYEPLQAVRVGLFEVVSIATTTGFATADFSIWPAMLPFLLFSTAFFGGCAGSTGGGIKVIRMLLIFKQGIREIKRLIHPHGVFAIKLGNTPVSDRVIDAVWGFFSVYLLVFIVLLISILATGIDQVTAWSMVGATLNNLGPGLGEVAAHYGDINEPAKWISCAAMLLGRLEVFTLIVLFTPMFWKK